MSMSKYQILVMKLEVFQITPETALEIAILVEDGTRMKAIDYYKNNSWSIGIYRLKMSDLILITNEIFKIVNE